MNAGYIGSLENARQLAQRLQHAGYNLIAFDPAQQAITAVTEGTLTHVALLHDLAEYVLSKRIILLDMAATPMLDEILEELKFSLTVSDVIIHIQPAAPEDTARRARDLEALQLHLLDCNLTHDTTANIVVGGNRFAFNDSLPLLQALAPLATYSYGGRTGSGHAASGNRTT